MCEVNTWVALSFQYDISLYQFLMDGACACVYECRGLL